ncbi:hypothetical protein THAOC_05827, partial [Thalassiosira oceanica]
PARVTAFEGKGPARVSAFGFLRRWPTTSTRPIPARRATVLPELASSLPRLLKRGSRGVDRRVLCSRSSGGGLAHPLCSHPAEGSPGEGREPSLGRLRTNRAKAAHKYTLRRPDTLDMDARRRRSLAPARDGGGGGDTASRLARSEGVAPRLVRSEHPRNSTLLPRPLRRHADSPCWGLSALC